MLPDVTAAAANPLLEDTQRALLNILEDVAGDRATQDALQRAFLNIMDDFDNERGRLVQTQSAALNILEDSALATERLEATQRGFLNLLEDAEADKDLLSSAERAMLNVLDDIQGDKEELRVGQSALLNILDDVDSESQERRAAEARVRQLNDVLEERVVQRTSELSAVNSELEAFAYSVSHDLRTPLRAIDGFSHMLSEDYAGVLDDAGRDALARIRRASQRMGELIDDMLKLSRATRSDMELGSVDVSQLAKMAAESVQAGDPDRAVEFRLSGPSICIGDARLLQSVLDNLIANAWKFTSRVKLPLIEFGSDLRDDRLVCWVRDNGAGFDMAFAHNLFLPFQRLHRESEFAGSGIGLATVKRVISRLGGQVWAEGSVGKGATFYFSLRRPSDGGEAT